MSKTDLSDRELQILRLLATGASTKEIAHQLHISYNTVKVHLRNIFSKIGVNSRTEAALYAINNGIAELPSPSPSASDATIPPSDPEIRTISTYLRGRRKWPIITMAILFSLTVLGVALGWQTMTARKLSAEKDPSVRWRVLAPMLTARYSFASVEYEGLIFVIAGHTGQGQTGQVERYDPTLDAWKPMSLKPTAVDDVGAVVIGGKIFVPGGRLGSGMVANRLEVYDPRSNSWQQAAPLPEPRSAYALAAFEGRAYLFGGWDGKNYVDSVYVYDPGEDRWQQKSPLPQPVGHHSAVVANGRIYIIGGFNGIRIFDSVYAYHPDLDIIGENPWIEETKIPTPRYGMGTTAIAEIVELVGGILPENKPAPSLSYFPINGTWGEFGEGDENQLMFPGLVVVGNYLHILGGKENESPINTHRAFQAIYTVSLPVIDR